MKSKISVPIFEEQDIREVIKKIMTIGETCKLIRQYYPSTWDSIIYQFGLDSWRDKKVSDSLFEKKLEIMLMQDDELRKK